MFVQTVLVALTDTQEQILDATMSCIVRDGIEGASLRNVAREADVSLGLLSYHFDDKRSLIEAAFGRATDRLYEATIAAVTDVEGPDEAVRAYIRGAFTDEFLTTEHLALRLSLWAIARTDVEIAAVERRLYERYEIKLAELIRVARPSLDASMSHERATDVIVTQNGLWLNWARHHDRDALERGLARCDAIALAD